MSCVAMTTLVPQSEHRPAGCEPAVQEAPERAGAGEEPPGAAGRGRRPARRLHKGARGAAVRAAPARCAETHAR
eukprot:scaffold1283_cov321-Prasinococcus_capsulatus_cf.AAC.2